MGTSVHRVLYVEQITNKDLLYSPGNYSVLYNDLYGGKVLKRRVDLCIESMSNYPCLLCGTPETHNTVSQPCSNKNKKLKIHDS